MVLRLPLHGDQAQGSSHIKVQTGTLILHIRVIRTVPGLAVRDNQLTFAQKYWENRGQAPAQRVPRYTCQTSPQWRVSDNEQTKRGQCLRGDKREMSEQGGTTLHRCVTDNLTPSTNNRIKTAQQKRRAMLH